MRRTPLTALFVTHPLPNREHNLLARNREFKIRKIEKYGYRPVVVECPADPAKITRAVRLALVTNPTAIVVPDGSFIAAVCGVACGPGVVGVIANGRLQVIEKCDVVESWDTGLSPEVQEEVALRYGN